MNRDKIVIAGGSGFLGQILAKRIAMWDREVVVLSRNPVEAPYCRSEFWDGETVGGWARELEGAAAVINLAGRSVNCRYTQQNRREILDSRVHATNAIGEAVARCKQPPSAWLNMSTATIYKHTYGAPHDESTGVIGGTPEVNDAFSVDVARAWEAAVEKSTTPATRKIILRTALVLRNAPGGVLDVLQRLARLGLGGTMGSGRQFVSWIHWIDFCSAIEWLIRTRDAAGVYNLASPNPVTNAELMSIVRRTCGVKFGLPASRWMLEIGAVFMGTETELILKSRNVIPGRLLDQGFHFSHPVLEKLIPDFTTGPRAKSQEPHDRTQHAHPQSLVSAMRK